MAKGKGERGVQGVKDTRGEYEGAGPSRVVNPPPGLDTPLWTYTSLNIVCIKCPHNLKKKHLVPMASYKIVKKL